MFVRKAQSRVISSLWRCLGGDFVTQFSTTTGYIRLKPIDAVEVERLVWFGI
jgi:hypothetical protein